MKFLMLIDRRDSKIECKIVNMKASDGDIRMGGRYKSDSFFVALLVRSLLQTQGLFVNGGNIKFDCEG